jgi:hypothetical protein
MRKSGYKRFGPQHRRADFQPNAARISGQRFGLTHVVKTFIPEGFSRIAQRFNVGFRARNVHKSRRDGRWCPPVSAVPSGLKHLAPVPKVKTLGYSQKSLRDKGSHRARIKPCVETLRYCHASLRDKCFQRVAKFKSCRHYIFSRQKQVLYSSASSSPFCPASVLCAFPSFGSRIFRNTTNKN